MTRPWDAARIAEVRALCEKATPGPWEHVPGGVNHRSTVAAEVVDAGGRQVLRTLEGHVDDGGIGAVTMTRGKFEREADNANFIASARNDLPEALAEIERLRNAFTQLECVRGMDTLDFLQVEGERDAARAALNTTAQQTSCRSCVRGDGTSIIEEMEARLAAERLVSDERAGNIAMLEAEVERLRALRCNCDEDAPGGHTGDCVTQLPSIVEAQQEEIERLRSENATLLAQANAGAAVVAADWIDLKRLRARVAELEVQRSRGDALAADMGAAVVRATAEEVRAVAAERLVDQMRLVVDAARRVVVYAEDRGKSMANIDDLANAYRSYCANAVGNL